MDDRHQVIPTLDGLGIRDTTEKKEEYDADLRFNPCGSVRHFARSGTSHGCSSPSAVGLHRRPAPRRGRLCRESGGAWREDFYYDHPYGHKGQIPRTVGVRGERYVYTRYIDPQPPFEQLFDLQEDPDQLVNLADHPDQTQRLLSMRQRCDELAGAVGRQR